MLGYIVLVYVCCYLGILRVLVASDSGRAGWSAAWGHGTDSFYTGGGYSSEGRRPVPGPRRPQLKRVENGSRSLELLASRWKRGARSGFRSVLCFRQG